MSLKPSEIEPYWNEKVKALKGKTIDYARYMSDEHQREFDWYGKSLEIVFTDGTSMILSQDDEGNGPGAAFTTIDGLETIPTLPGV